MDAVDELDAQVNQLAVAILAVGGPTALMSDQETSRFERMAQEFEYAIRNTSADDMATLLGHLASDGGSAVAGRISGLWGLLESVVEGTVDEITGAVRAYSDDRLVDHLGGRIGNAAAVTSNALANAANSLSDFVDQLKADPAEAGPKLLVLALSSVAVSGGVDGNGGAPDLDIPLMGIGAHRSPFTHSILMGSLLEAVLMSLTRLVMCTHKNLPLCHDPLWDDIKRQSVGILSAAGKGASIGMAYHLMVDSVAQPGTYHGLPIDLPIEAHQTIMAANSVAEATAVKSYPGRGPFEDPAPEVLAAHQRYRNSLMNVPDAVREWLLDGEVAILVRHGAWLDALATNLIPPVNLKQLQFVNVAAGKCAPVADHEKAWVSFTEAKSLSGLGR